MARQKKIMDIHEDSAHLVVIKSLDRGVINPYRIYVVISGPGMPVRRRLINKYGDFMSVIYFLRDFYQDGIDTCTLPEMLDWVRMGYGDA